MFKHSAVKESPMPILNTFVWLRLKDGCRILKKTQPMCVVFFIYQPVGHCSNCYKKLFGQGSLFSSRCRFIFLVM